MSLARNRFVALAGERKAFAARRPSTAVSMPKPSADDSSSGFLVNLLPSNAVDRNCTVAAVSLSVLFAAVVTIFPQQFFDAIDSVPVLARFFSPF